MRKLIPILFLLATPALAQEYNIPFVPKTVASGGTIYAEADCSDITEWTDASTAGSGWADAGSDCEGRVDADWEEAAMVQGPLSTTSEFCSFKVTQISTSSVKIGCVFRAPGTPGDHYAAYFNQQNDNYGLENHDGDDASKHGFVNDVNGNTDCGCSGTYVDLAAGDYAGIVLSGTGTSTAITFYDMGAVAPSDMQDPSTFAAAADRSCACDAGEIAGDPTFTEIDTAGSCGPESTNENSTNKEPNVSTFACGDTP